MPLPGTAPFAVTRVAAESEVFEDLVAIEEPLEIAAAWSVDGEPREKTISVTMRTPGDDFDLAAGFLFTEGLLQSVDDIESVRHWGSANRVRVALRNAIDLSRAHRHSYTSSACGVCGKTSIDAVSVTTSALTPMPVRREVIEPAARALHDAQTAFRATGGVHGAALVDADGALLAAREDVGRHNAVDKVIGALLRERQAFDHAMLVVSSRAGFEIVQKAVVARIAALITIGAPSSLAIDLARRSNVTLVGFVRDHRFNVYAGSIE